MNRKTLWVAGLGVAGIVLLALGIAGIRRGARASTSHAGAPAGGAAPVSAQPATAGAPAASSARTLLAQAEAARAQGARLEAKGLYQQVLQQSPDPQLAAAAQEQLGKTNIEILFSPTLAPEDSAYTVQPGDTLTKIARKSGATVELLRVSNGVRGDLIRAGQRLKVPQVSFSVVVDKSQNTLTLKNGEEVVKVYRCSTGREGITPAGTFRIVSRMVDPVWKGVVPPGHPENPLGSRWLGFDLPQYGIHGTSDPDTIGKPVTQGCVRLANSDVEELYTLLAEGTSVAVVE